MIRLTKLEGKQRAHADRLKDHWHKDEEAKRLITQALLSPAMKYVYLEHGIPLGAVSFVEDNSRYVYTERGERVFDGGFPVIKVENLGSLMKGIGTRLLKKVELEAALRGISIVIPTTEASAGFYKKLGYSFRNAIAYKS